MAISYTQFQTFYAQWRSDMEKLLEEVDTWLDNMQDQNPSYDFTTDQGTLTTLRSTLETDLETLQGQV